MIDRMSSVTTKAMAHPFQTDDARLRPVHEKVLARQSLDLADVSALFASKDILALGWLANYVREQKHGPATRYAVDMIVASAAANAAGCAICGRTRPQSSIDAQLEQAGTRFDEFIVLAHDPRNLEPCLRSVEAIKSHQPQARVSTSTVEEIAATNAGSAEDVCRSLLQAGADGLIGEGAEVFLPALRHRLWHHAGTAEQRMAVRQAALAAGLKVPLAMVQRSADSPSQQAAELVGVRELAQNAASFASLSFVPDPITSLDLPVTTGIEEMKQIAIARLALESVDHIRAYWEMLGGKLLQIALRFGASDLDGASLDPGVNVEARRRELGREIQVAGREPHDSIHTRKLVLLSSDKV